MEHHEGMPAKKKTTETPHDVAYYKMSLDKPLKDMPPIEKTPEEKRLDKANIGLSKELFTIKSSLDVYKVIGLNAPAIQKASPLTQAFFGLTQMQSQRMAILGLSKVFEPEKDHKLYSIRGICGLAKQVEIKDPAAADRYVKHYDVNPSGNWKNDVDSVRAKRGVWVKESIKQINTVRNRLLAHLDQSMPEPILPGMDKFYDLLEYAVLFHTFINDAFVPTFSHPILEDTIVKDSFVRLLEQIGVNNPVLDYPDLG